MSHYRKLVVAFVSFTVAMVFITSVIVGVRVRAVTVQTVAETMRAQLGGVRDAMEEGVFASHELLVLDLLRSTLYPQLSSPMNALVFDRQIAPTRIRDVSAILLNVVISRASVVNVTVVVPGAGIVVDSRSYYSSLARSPDRHLLETIEGRDRRRWFVRSTVDENYRPIEVLTYLSTIPYNASGDRVRGYLYVDVDAGLLRTLLAQRVESEGWELSLINASGTTVVSTAAEPERLEAFVHRLESDPDGFLAEGDVVAASLGSPDGDRFRYVATVASPVFFRQVRAVVLVVVIAAAFSIVLGLLLSIWLARRFYHPLASFMRTLGELSIDDITVPFGDEFHVMDHTVRALAGRLDALSERLENRELFELLTLGRPPEESDSATGHGLIGALVIVLQIVHDDGDALRRTVRTASVPGRRFISFTVNDRELAVVVERVPPVEESVGGDDPSLDVAVQYLSVGARSGGVAGPVEDPSDLRECYEQARRAMRYGAFLGFSGIVPASRLVHLGEATSVDTRSLFSELLAGDTGRAAERLTNLETHAAGGEVTVESVERQVARVAFVFAEAAQQRGVSALLPPILSHIQRLADTGQTRRAFAVLRGALESYRHMVMDTETSSQARTAGRVRAFIEGHLDQPLSLEQLAEMVSLSPTYLSRLFKEAIGESFVAYVGRRRMETAAELLRDDDRPVLKEVAARVGYSNVQYFMTRFKRRFGVSPARYRAASVGRFADDGTEAEHISERDPTR